MAKTSLTRLAAKRIALLKPSALGDIVHSLPILSALRVRFPQSQISWVVNRAYAPLLENHVDLNDVVAFDRGDGLRAAVALARALRRRRFDLVIDLQGLLRTGLMALATRAPRRVGLATAREGSRFAYTDVVAVPENLHAVDRYWLVAEALGVGELPKRFHVPISEENRTWALQLLAGLPRPWIVVAAGARWVTKRWPAASFAQLLRWSRERHGGSAILIGSRDESPLLQALARQIPEQTRDLTGKTSLPQLAAILSLADAILANDTGPMHLAAALGRPVVAPYTCTQIRLHGPYGQMGAVASRVWCRGSYLKRCARLDCMHELTPDRLWPVLDEVLSQWANRSRSA